MKDAPGNLLVACLDRYRVAPLQGNRETGISQHVLRSIGETGGVFAALEMRTSERVSQSQATQTYISLTHAQQVICRPRCAALQADDTIGPAPEAPNSKHLTFLLLGLFIAGLGLKVRRSLCEVPRFGVVGYLI